MLWASTNDQRIPEPLPWHTITAHPVYCVNACVKALLVKLNLILFRQCLLAFVVVNHNHCVKALLIAVTIDCSTLYRNILRTLWFPDHQTKRRLSQLWFSDQKAKQH